VATRTFADGGWSTDDPKRQLYETVRRPVPNVLPDTDHGKGTNLRFGTRENRRDSDVMISKFPSIEEIRVVVADETAAHTHHAINSIDFFSGACHSSRRFWHKRSQVTIVRDRDTRRAGPVRAAFLFALQSRRVTPPQWREHRGLKTP